MKTLALRTTNLKCSFEQFNESLGGELESNFNEHTLQLDNGIGRGTIKGIKLDGEISYLQFDIEFSENFILVCDSSENTPICFAYCSLGSVAHSFGMEGPKHKLDSFQTGILTSRVSEDNVIYFEKDVSLKTTLIIVGHEGKGNERMTLNQNLQELFFKEIPGENFVYVGSYNLKIAEKIQQLNAVSQKGVTRNFMLLGLVHMILALEIEQHAEDVRNSSRNNGSLTVREMDAIQELTKFIRNYPERQLSVPYLGKKGGLSPSKLQEGFKLMHGTTVTDFIREIRVKKAEELIKNSDLNISEIVYSIGFTSRSYFSKIFKAKYNCSPKQYKDHQNLMAVAIS